MIRSLLGWRSPSAVAVSLGAERSVPETHPLGSCERGNAGSLALVTATLEVLDVADGEILPKSATGLPSDGCNSDINMPDSTPKLMTAMPDSSATASVKIALSLMASFIFLAASSMDPLGKRSVTGSCGEVANVVIGPSVLHACDCRPTVRCARACRMYANSGTGRKLRWS